MTKLWQDLVTATVGGLVGGGIAFLIARFTLRRERERSVLERREQYIVDACRDVVDRTWAALNVAETALNEDRIWNAYTALDNLSVQMWGQGPRYRHAGIAKFSDSIRDAATSFLSATFVESGMTKSRLDLRTVLQAERERLAADADPSAQSDLSAIEAELALLSEEISADAARTKERLQRFRAVLRHEFKSKISSYIPGEPLDGFETPK